MISVQSLRFSYGRQPVLRGVSFTLENGGLTAVLGKNGAGKTTLFRCLLGLAQYEGSVALDGAEVRRLSAGALAQKIAYIPQSHYPAFQYSVFDMVLMGTTGQVGPLASPGEKQRRRAEEALKRMRLWPLRDRGFLRLSGGEQQMVLIARALAQETRTLLMDEPTASLDYGNQLRVLSEARQLAKNGYTVLMNCHNPQHVLSFADRVIALDEGTICRDGEPKAVLNSELILRLYGVNARFADTENGCVLIPQGGLDDK